MQNKAPVDEFRSYSKHQPLVFLSMTNTKILSLLSALLLIGTLNACATAPTDPAARAEFEEANDPLEPMNRSIFGFNMFVDRIVFKPLAKAYRWAMPDFAQDVVHNVLQNAGEPVTFMNAVLQGRLKDANTTAGRFLVNTVAGVGGIADVASASPANYKPVHADFGQTLHTFGAPEGPYLVLPILGPSNPRDAAGFAVDSLAEPWPYVIMGASGPGTRNRYLIAQTAANALDQRSRALDALDALEKSSIDFYAQMRSITRQYRHAQLGKKGVSEIGKTEAGAVQGVKPFGLPD
jgi:phospholipid-binding lipoprotein MlaA